MAGDKDQKTEKPTAKRMRKARQEGQIPKSQELIAWSTMFAIVSLLRISVSLAGDRFPNLLQRSATVMESAEPGPALTLFGLWMTAGAIVLAPLLLGTMVVGVAGNVAQTGWAPS